MPLESLDESFTDEEFDEKIRELQEWIKTKKRLPQNLGKICETLFV